MKHPTPRADALRAMREARFEAIERARAANDKAEAIARAEDDKAEAILQRTRTGVIVDAQRAKVRGDRPARAKAKPMAKPRKGKPQPKT